MSSDGGDYATSKYLRWHRRLSVTLVVVLFAYCTVHFGVGQAIRLCAAFVVPLILIWFSDDLAAWGSTNSGTWFSATRGDTYVRICAWLIILLLCTLRLMVLLSD